MTDTITITCEVWRPGDDNVGPGTLTSRTIPDLPSWCSGDPAMAAALYLFGNRDAVEDIRNARVED